ncbi:hypothetical protein BHE74_00056428, partial [Ensete ventricosum]
MDGMVGNLSEKIWTGTGGGGRRRCEEMDLDVVGTLVGGSAVVVCRLYVVVEVSTRFDLVRIRKVAHRNSHGSIREKLRMSERSRDKENEGGRDKEREWDREKERDNSRLGRKERGQDREKERHRDRHRDYDRGRSTNDERGRDKFNERDRFQSLDNDRLPVCGPPATECHQKSIVGGRLREKSTADGRLRKKSTVGSRLSEKNERRRGKEEKKKRGEEKEYLATVRRCRPRVVRARAPSPPAGSSRQRVVVARGSQSHFLPRGEKDRGDV